MRSEVEELPETAGPGGAGPLPERVLGEIRGDAPGAMLICVGGVHGNEPAGVLAAKRVLPVLAARSAHMSGDFVALAGNLSALARGRRFIDRDLNRAWTRRRLGKLARGESVGSQTEDREQAELFHVLAHCAARARGPLSLVDFHTTSGEGGPFSTVSDTLPNRTFGLHFPVPLILGLEEEIEGTMMDYLNELGPVALIFESGQHDEARAVDRAEAAMWLSIVGAGLLPLEQAPEARAGFELLAVESRPLPRVLEVRYRHPVKPRDGFTMRAGYRNFQAIREGELLAHDARGPVHAPSTARILMPLYQAQGDDGFFVVREFRPLWLRVSGTLRRAGADRIVHWLPGIRRARGFPDMLVINRRVARWYALELLHLLGYRRHRDAGRHLVVLRRRSGPPLATDDGAG